MGGLEGCLLDRFVDYVMSFDFVEYYCDSYVFDSVSVLILTRRISVLMRALDILVFREIYWEREVNMMHSVPIHCLFLMSFVSGISLFLLCCSFQD